MATSGPATARQPYLFPGAAADSLRSVSANCFVIPSNSQRLLVGIDEFIRPKAVLEEQGRYAAEIGFSKLFRPSGERVGILGENHRTLFDIRLGEDFEVVADDMSIRRIRGGEAFDCFVIVRRADSMAEIEGDDVEMLQRKIACRLATPRTPIRQVWRGKEDGHSPHSAGSNKRQLNDSGVYRPRS